MASLRDLIDRAEDLGIEDQVAELIEAYVEAAEAYEDNREHPVDGVAVVSLAPLPEAVWSLGELARVEYDRIEDGAPVRRYHDFEDDKPLLAVDEDGHNLWIVGGTYEVTKRGIVG